MFNYSSDHAIKVCHYVENYENVSFELIFELEWKKECGVSREALLTDVLVTDQKLPARSL